MFLTINLTRGKNENDTIYNNKTTISNLKAGSSQGLPCPFKVFGGEIMHFKLFILFCIVIPTLSGCSTFFAHYRVSDDSTQVMAYANAVADVCVSNNLLEFSDVEEYKYYSASLLGISVYNKKVYEQTYNKFISHSSNFTKEQMYPDCISVKQKFASAATKLKSEYHQTAQWLSRARAAEMQSISTSINTTTSTLITSPILTVPPPTIFSATPNNMGTNSVVNSGGLIRPNSYNYQSSTGLNYKYDLSNPSDKVMYDVDPAAKVMDDVNVDPRVDIDRSLGQYGGGIDQ
jgi:hypothetical protein